MCLRVWDWSETSQTALLLTRGSGVMRVLAKGSRRPKGDFSGGLSVLTRGTAELIVRPAGPLSAKQETPLTILKSWDLEEIFPSLRRSLAGFYGGMYAADICGRLLHEHDAHPEVLDALVGLLRGLEAAGGEARALAGFLWELLRRTGHRPELGRDAQSGGELPEGPVLWFSPGAGGLVSEGAVGQDVWGVRRETVEAMRSLEGEGGGGPGSESAAWGRACGLLGRYASLVAGAETPSLSLFLRAVGRGDGGG